MTLDPVWTELIKWVGIPATLFIFWMWSGHKQVWVWGRELAGAIKALLDMTADRDRWRDRCFSDAETNKAELKELRQMVFDLLSQLNHARASTHRGDQ
jgi:hypothetical protein